MAWGIGRAVAVVQVLEAKEEAVETARFEEAALLRERELDLKAALVAPAEQAPRIALVDTPAIEQARRTPLQADLSLQLQP